MLNINIITAYTRPIFLHQLDAKRYEGVIKFCENSHEDIVWDYIVVFQNYSHDFDGIKYRQGGLIFIAGEPESMEPYCNRFFSQFDYVILPHPHRKGQNIYHTNPAVNWHFGRSFSTVTFAYTYNDLINLESRKKKNISMMCSTKTMMPGHVQRYKFYKLISQVFNGQIDFFGAGIKLVEDKADILLPYRFHICIENSRDDHYWTEKIADPILGYSIPIYYGAPNIYDYFPEDALIVIDIKKPKEAFEIIQMILSNPEEEYQKRLPALIEARRRLLDKYNIFPMLEDFIASNKSSFGSTCKLDIKSYAEMMKWKLNMIFARIKRMLYKIIH